MDDGTEYECGDCGRRFTVTWCSDQQTIVDVCPFCACDDLIKHCPPPGDND